MTPSTAFTPDLEALLAPIAGASPSGESMRYDPLYQSIRKAREEDDASLPMGVWERDLKRADWRAVAEHCSALLGQHSKDFQVAAWLCEAWIHLHQVAGFNAAADVLTALVDRYWDTAHPQMDGADLDARLAPFLWINENLPRVLKLHVILLRVPDCVPAAASLADWEQCLRSDHAKTDIKTPPGQAKPLTRDELVSQASGHKLQGLLELKTQLAQAITKWEALASLLDEKLASDPQNAISLARVGETLRQIERAAVSLIDGRQLPASSAAGSITSAVSNSDPTSQDQTMDALPPPPPAPTEAPELILRGGPVSSLITSREEAYRLLEAVASYLQKSEPHSPTPYLVKRAVSWGRMSLADLMQEVVREEGDIARYFSLLGIKESRE
jgi:type VI secretion system protein ImpA